MKQKTKENGLVISFLVLVVSAILASTFKDTMSVFNEMMLVVAFFSLLGILFFGFFEKISEFFSDL